MLRGIHLMKEKELVEIARLLGYQGSFGPEVLLAWMGQAVGCESEDPNTIERATLNWTAKLWGVDFHPALNTDDLERLLRVRIATDACEYLQPNWRIAAALAANGRANTLRLKVKMLQQAANLAAPSRSVIRELRAEWDRLTKEWMENDPRSDLQADIETLKARGDNGKECLALGLILGLVDGHSSMEAERLFRDLCEALEVPAADTLKILDRVKDLFWRHHNAAAPVSGEAQKVSPDAAQAAEKALEDSGTLEALASETATALIARAFPKEEKRSAWSRVVGALSGLPQFLSKKIKDEHKAVVVRIVYLSILKQHEEWVKLTSGEEEEPVVEATPSAPPRAAAAPPPPPPPAPMSPVAPVAEPLPVEAAAPQELPQVSLATDMVAESGPTRKISLDP